MGYTVTIRNNATGEICSEHYDFEFHGFWWSLNGNMGCDCNREIIFNRQLHGLSYGYKEFECSEGRFNVVKIVLDSGEDVTNTVEELNA